MTNAAQFGEQAKRLSREGDYAAAEAELRAGLVQHPRHQMLEYALGILLLARGEHREGWDYYENRRAFPGLAAPPPGFPEWGGEVVESLLVLPEQGLGDQIMFARYVPQLVARGMRVTLATPPPLAVLFRHLGAEVVAVDGATPIARHDAWCLIGSLPRHLGTLPTEAYLPGGAGGSGVGMMLTGGPRAADRSLPDDMAARLADLGRSLHPQDTGARDFSETAEIIRGLSLVVSVDTSVAHLAGAMGKQVWVLLPEPSDWRWGRGASSPWYPTARLFRQARSGDWGAVVEAVRSQL